MKRDLPEVELVGPTEPLPASPDRIVSVLAPLVTPERLARFEAVIARRTRSVIPVLEGLSDPHNGAAILRSADAFGCQEAHLVEGRFPFAVSHRVSRGTHRWIDLVKHDTSVACADALHARGYRIFVADMAGTVTPEDLAQHPRVAIVFGNEHKGISDEMTARADGVYRIPMVGFVESLNVSVASAITLYVAARARQGDLSEEDRAATLARYLMSQVRDAARIVRDAG